MIKKLITQTTAVAVLGGALFIAPTAFANTTVSPSVVQHYNQAVITWTTQPNTKCYRIYYKETNATKWQHAVQCRDLPATSFSYTIKGLKPNTAYTYEIAAVSKIDKKETFLGIKQMLPTPQM